MQSNCRISALAGAVLLMSITTLGYTMGSPEQISLNYGSEPSEMVVTWAVVENNISTQFVEFGEYEKLLKNSVEAIGQSYATSSYTSPMLYKATISGLESGNKEYYYRVGSAETGYSEVLPFKSHPGIGVEAVTFHVIGDLGQTENSINTLNELSADEAELTESGDLSGGFILVGDLSYANGNQPQWDTYGNMKQFVSEGIPSFMTVGNHEWFDSSDKSFVAYTARYDNPPVNGKKELYYSFDAGLIHWTMVAGYCQEMKSVLTMPCLDVGTAQYEWLLADLASVNKTLTPWTVVVFHEPYVNSNYAHDMKSEGAPMQSAIEDILYEAKVDLVFSGHVHAYERSCQVYKYECIEGAPYYITIGDGGNAEGLATDWIEPQPEWSVFRQSSYGHGELTAFNTTHMYWSWNQNADLEPVGLDSFWFVKDAAVTQAHKTERTHFTGEAKFADSERGRRGARWNEARNLQKLKQH